MTREAPARDEPKRRRRTTITLARILGWTLSACAVVYLAAGAVLFSIERRLVYAPDTVAVAPGEVGLGAAQVVTIETADGERLVGWFLPGEATAPLALYFHGSGGSLADRADQIARLRSFGLAVLAIDYRGFGGSSGSPSEAGLILDAEAAYHRAETLGWEASRIVVVGQSLGTGVATALAARHRFAGLLLDSPFAALVDVAAERHPAFPVGLLMRDRFRSDRIIADVGTSVLFLHGEEDDVVPPHHGARLFALAAQPKLRLTVPGAGHRVLDDESLTPALKAWFAGVVGSGDGAVAPRERPVGS